MTVQSSQSSKINSVPVFKIESTQRDFFGACCAEYVQPDSRQKQRVQEKLLEILLTLNVSGFEQCIALLLRALEYGDVQIMRSPQTKRRSHKGRNRHGGFDLTAFNTTFAPSLTLVQVKQYQRPVSRRFVDELRGAMLRQGAQQGLLITASTFPRKAIDSAQENTLLPIRLIDGEELVDLLFQNRIGVRCKERVSKKGNHRLVWRIDSNFFRALQ